MFDFETMFKIAEEDKTVLFSTILKRLEFRVSPYLLTENNNGFIFRIWDGPKPYYLRVFTTSHTDVDPKTFEQVPPYCRTSITVLNHDPWITYENGVDAWNDIIEYIESETHVSIAELSNGNLEYERPI